MPRYLNALSYKSLEEHLGVFFDLTSLKHADLLETRLADLKEIKATRNLLLHNDLIVNDQYLETAGVKRRSHHEGSRLKLDYLYVAYVLDNLCSFETNIRDALSKKYASYTKIIANKELWGFLFRSPMMEYDDYWAYNIEEDRIFAMKYCDHECQISNTEALLLALWRAHFSGHGGEHMQRFNMKHFDENNQRRIHFFLSIAGSFSFE